MLKEKFITVWWIVVHKTYEAKRGYRPVTTSPILLHQKQQIIFISNYFILLMLLVGHQEEHPICKKLQKQSSEFLYLGLTLSNLGRSNKSAKRKVAAIIKMIKFLFSLQVMSTPIKLWSEQCDIQVTAYTCTDVRTENDWKNVISDLPWQVLWRQRHDLRWRPTWAESWDSRRDIQYPRRAISAQPQSTTAIQLFTSHYIVRDRRAMLTASNSSWKQSCSAYGTMFCPSVVCLSSVCL